MLNKTNMLAIGISVVLAVGLPAMGVSIDMVPVGNPGNAGEQSRLGHGDTNYYGGVDYEYRIGKYEVTENQWDTVVAADPSDLLDDAGYWSGDQPVTEISWHDAAMFCNWVTSGDVTQGAYAIDGSGEVTGIDRAGAVSTYGTVYVIPTEDEWYKAAYYDPNKPGGAGYWDYPTRHDDPTPPDGIDSVGDTAFDAVFDDGYDQGYPSDVDDAGVLSAYGTMGQGGNVWEWNETLIGSYRGLRGGAFFNDDADLHAFYRDDYTPTFEHDGLGFRVAVVPEPASAVIFLVGLIAAMRRTRRK